MKLGFCAGVLISLLGTFAYAEPTLKPEPAAPVQNQPKKFDPMAACSARFKATEKNLVASFVNGATFEVLKDDSGMPQSYTYTSPEGEQQTAQVSDFVQKIQGEASQVPEDANKRAAYLKLRRKAVQSFRLFLGANCKRSMINPQLPSVPLPDGGAQSPRALTTGGGNVRPADEYGDYEDFFGDWDWLGDMSESGFQDMAGDMVADSFFDGMEFYANEVRNRSMPVCKEVVADCQATCTRIGAYGAGVACTALGGAAGVFLSPPIGIAVGAYCGGKVFVAVEECRGGCQMPVVQCTW